VRDRIVKSFAK